MNNIDTKKDLVTQILSLAIEISTTSIIDIFVDYSSHVKGLSVRILLKGWSALDNELKYDFNRMIYLDWEDSEEKLKKVLDYLKKIKEEL